MKARLFIIFFLLYCSDAVNAQTLVPSTVRQIFSLQKGDSLEYHIWNIGAGCATYCNWYELKIVDSISYNSTLDTLFISFQTRHLFYDTSGTSIDPCGPCQEGFNFQDVCPVTAQRWAFTDLDSSIVYFLDTAYGGIRPGESGAADSSYYNNLYNGSKQNLYGFEVGGFSGTNETYVDSIGIAYKAETVELSRINREQLIYYRKANGRQWGTPYMVSGLQNISKGDGISIYPNPAKDKFIIQCQPYAGMHFSLFDALSKRIMCISLKDNETAVNSNNLPAGIYFWQITDNERVIETGKLVME